MERIRRWAFAGSLLLAALFGAGTVGAQGGATREAPPSGTRPEAAPLYRIPLTGTVEMGLAPFVQRSLREAAASGARAAILDIDTPGGRIDAAEQIVDAVSDAEIPVYAYVNRRALSAGALIALATDRIYMRPGSTLGAATPVTGDGAQASEKIVSAMRSAFRALAEARDLDPHVAEAMVDEQIGVEGLVEPGKLLTLSTDEAVRIGYAQAVADWAALEEALGAKGASVIEMRVNWAERVVRFLTHPLVSPFLLSLGFLGLLIEIKTPTFGMAGLTGVAALGLFFGSHFIIGLAGWEVVILLGLGVLLLLVELFFLPGFGVAGVLGALALAASVLLSLIGTAPSTGEIMTAVNILIGAMLIVGFVGWQLLRRLPEDRRARQLLHREELTRELGYVSAQSRDDLIGKQGMAITDLRPAGTVRIGDERLDVVSEGPWIAAGTTVRIIRAEGYRHVVEPIG